MTQIKNSPAIKSVRTMCRNGITVAEDFEPCNGLLKAWYNDTRHSTHLKNIKFLSTAKHTFLYLFNSKRYCKCCLLTEAQKNIVSKIF